ncbi:electroneutral sodium bicarbonate exchanger 1-like isoform X2 [Argiope bruennichi]|uniref:Anion exchange protein n=1 Tax=Argiope bruennichi TaxID=94029 RepID=A0A8T0FX89_ARGBR|nr:electroneutral sodium bicarbonate exchanger 1-like isoform X2 [Argiope bruennichi]KAF8795352.1 Sodium-driven chloride bicarbonate exchanger like protein [Argiope bruennichi]
MEDNTEASVDPGASLTRRYTTRYDSEDHHACMVYIGYRVPGYRRRSHHRRRHSQHHYYKPGYCGESDCEHDVSKPVTPPSERVHFILGEEEDGTHEPHPLFSEMEELFQKGNDIEWRETARWIKFEEDVEEGGNRWSKPHVATVSLHSLFELRSCILNGTILLDMDANSLEEITDLILENIESSQQITVDVKAKIKESLLKPHRHQHQLQDDWSDKGSRLPIIRSLTDVRRNSSKMNSSRNSASTGVLSDTVAHNLSSLSFRALANARSCTSPEETSSDNLLHKINQSFMRKIPPKAEASNILVGEVDYLDKIVSSFVRLTSSCSLGDLTEVPVPTRFLFILLGPVGHALRYHEIGRAMATLLSDEVFHGVAYKAKNRTDLLAGVDEFLDATTVLPPGVWDPRTRIEPPTQTASQEARKKIPEPNKETKIDTSASETSSVQVEMWAYDEKLFSGLVTDVRRKLQWYISDARDSLSVQCISSIVFLYFACIAQIITFGGLLAKVTKNKMASLECLFAALLCGVSYSLFSGQPLTLLGSTGPVLAFESMVFEMCENYGLDFLPMRVWIGLWTFLYLFLFVAFNLASLVRYITRFTEEIFATLVSSYFIYKAFKNVLEIANEFPLMTRNSPFYPMCVCLSPTPNYSIVSEDECQTLGGISAPSGCSYTPPTYVPNIFLMSVILFISTFGLILLLRHVKRTPFFTTKIRTLISDFAVMIAVIAMTFLDVCVGLGTPKLEVPQSFKPSSSDREWLVPFFGNNPWWTAIVATVPALFLTMLVFMDQQITTLIVNRKENKLKKGCGYHLDLFIIACLIAICSIFGLPWFVAATILSMTHVNSLKKFNLPSAPGEKRQFLGVREQRVTHFCVFILIGLSVFFTSILQYIPMPILYGVFLFMGVKCLKGLQFYERILLMLMPEKYQPDYSYLRHVPIRNVLLYTLLQLFLCALLFACKLFKPTAFAFPVLLLGVIFVRKLLGRFFNKTHLKMLDDVMPEAVKDKDSTVTDKLLPGNLTEVVCVSENDSKETVMSKQNSHANINISEVLMQSSIWKCIDQQSQKTTRKILAVKSKKKKHRSHTSSKTEENRRLSVMEEDDEEYANSTDTPVSPMPYKSPSDSLTSDTPNGTNV